MKYTRDTLQAHRSALRAAAPGTTVLVGMGTCGIAAGAAAVFQTLQNAIAAKGLTNVALKPTGCLGLCFSEPTVEVKTVLGSA